jgi:2-hydroxy-6-oxonona-2,4-dienedioate hydrolase
MASMWVDMLGAQVRFHRVKGINTRVIEAGSGPAVIFLHGSGGHAEAFARNIVPLASRYRVVAMDYLGSGLTDYPAHRPTMQDRADHIVDLMDTMGIRDACLAGESFGGTQAFAVATLYPERVRSVAAIVGGTFAVETDEASSDQWERAMLTMVERQRDFLANPSRETVMKRLAWLFADAKFITEELVDVRWRFYQREAVRRSVSDMTDMIAEDVAARRNGTPVAQRTDALRPMTVEDLQSVKHPTLFLWTAHNPSISANTARIAAGHVPGSKFVLMDHCAHWPQWENPAAFNTILADFLEKSA